MSKYKPPGGLYLEGRFNGRFFPLPVWEGLIHGRAYFRNSTVFDKGRVQRDHKTIPSTKGMTLITVQELTSTMPGLSPF